MLKGLNETFRPAPRDTTSGTNEPFEIQVCCVFDPGLLGGLCQVQVEEAWLGVWSNNEPCCTERSPLYLRRPEPAEDVC